jgi:ABC-type transport system involved in multi-copper enzyme maturation permease subunit
MHSLLSSMLGPMFAKEMVEIARRKRYFVNRVLYGLALLFTVFVVWDNYRGRFPGAQRVSIHLMAEIAEALFHAVSAVQYGAVFLFVPLFLCGVIASEREERTLDLLFTTRLTDREIVLGKLGSRVAVVVFLVFFSLPVISLIMLFGGVDPQAVWRGLACTLLAILYAGAHAIYFSTVTKSAMGALVRTYWWLAVWLIGMPMAVMIPATTVLPTLGVLRVCTGVLVMIDPLFAFGMTMEGGSYNQVASYLGAWFFPLTFVVPSGWAFFLLWRAVRRLRLAPTPLARVLEKIPLLRTLRRDLRETAKMRALGRERRAGRLWPFFKVRNPLWLRSRLIRVYDREGYIGRIQWLAWFVAFFFLLLMLLFDPRELRSGEAGIVFLAPSWLALAALTAIFAGSSFVGDRRRGFLDLVLMTPLTPREIIDGTLLSIWQHVRRLYWLPLVFGLFFCLTGSCTLVGLLCSIITATLFCILLTVHGTACSLTAKTLPGALVLTFVFPLLLNLGMPCLIAIFRHGSGPVLWCLSALFFSATWLWLRRGTSAASVGCYFMAVHLAMACLVSCWTVSHHEEYPIALIHPAYMSVRTLDGEPHSWFPDLGWVFPPACYGICLTVNIIWARRWLIRNFARLVERTDRPTPPVSMIRKGIVRSQPEMVGVWAKE